MTINRTNLAFANQRLFCKSKGRTFIEYAVVCKGEHFFVSKYLYEFPSNEIIRYFLREKIREVGDG